MPGIFRSRGFRFHFYSNEGDPREPLHVHVVKGAADAKFWLYPSVSVAYNRGFTSRTLAQLLEEIESRRGQIEKAWNEHFG
ncbi:MAG: DUF4160 domain-containing protein [Caulobacteraceae bacterium]